MGDLYEHIFRRRRKGPAGLLDITLRLARGSQVRQSDFHLARHPLTIGRRLPSPGWSPPPPPHTPPHTNPHITTRKNEVKWRITSRKQESTIIHGQTRQKREPGIERKDRFEVGVLLTPPATVSDESLLDERGDNLLCALGGQRTPVLAGELDNQTSRPLLALMRAGRLGDYWLGRAGSGLATAELLIRMLGEQHADRTPPSADTPACALGV